MTCFDKLLRELRVAASSDVQVAVARALADDNGYLLVAGYSITGRDPMATYAWLVEWPGTQDMPVRWWHPEHGWTIDASRALRFARKEDAEAYIERPGGAGRLNPAVATEHVWMS